jgi:hypothetical protein
MDDVSKQIRSTPQNTQVLTSISLEDLIDSDHYFAAEIELDKVKSAIAAQLEVSTDSIDIVAEMLPEGRLQISYANVFIDAAGIDNILSKQNAPRLSSPN